MWTAARRCIDIEGRGLSGQVPQPIKHVAVVGVGSMGQHMVRHILTAGFNLTVCDANPDTLLDFARQGMRAVAKPAECTGCDAVIILVATPEQVRTVAIGEGGVRDMAERDLPRYLVVASTIAPNDMHVLSDAFAGRPVRVVDAPVSGGVVGAKKAMLTFLAGGADADVAALRPLFLSMGQAIYHCGAVGAGQLTKAINNIIAITNLMVSAEAYSIALANGLTLEKLIPALDAGSARNFLSRDPADPPEVYGAWSGTEQEFQSVRSINQKDVDLALALCPDGLHVPSIRALRQLLQEVNENTLDNWRNIARASDPHR
jgi:3-hydroxyisobutyrate dehydrogenase-like beta-hydroxyacid dehydrogenase